MSFYVILFLPENNQPSIFMFCVKCFAFFHTLSLFHTHTHRFRTLRFPKVCYVLGITS